MKPRGLTKIYDTCCLVLDDLIKNEEKNKNKMKLFVLITDGEDNSSIFYDFKDLKQRVSNFKKQKNTNAIFIGANIDAIKTGNKFGFDKDTSLQMGSDPISAKCAMKCLSSVSTRSIDNKKIKFNTIQRHLSNQLQL